MLVHRKMNEYKTYFESSQLKLWDEAVGVAELGEASGNVADVGCGCTF